MPSNDQLIAEINAYLNGQPRRHHHHPHPHHEDTYSARELAELTAYVANMPEPPKSCIQAQVVNPGTGETTIHVIGDVPPEALDGIRASFTTSYDFVPESVEVFLNGLRQQVLVDYNTSGERTVILFFSPGPSEILSLNYQRR